MEGGDVGVPVNTEGMVRPYWVSPPFPTNDTPPNLLAGDGSTPAGKKVKDGGTIFYTSMGRGGEAPSWDMGMATLCKEYVT